MVPALWSIQIKIKKKRKKEKKLSNNKPTHTHIRYLSLSRCKLHLMESIVVVVVFLCNCHIVRYMVVVDIHQVNLRQVKIKKTGSNGNLNDLQLFPYLLCVCVNECHGGGLFFLNTSERERNFFFYSSSIQIRKLTYFFSFSKGTPLSQKKNTRSTTQYTMDKKTITQKKLKNSRIHVYIYYGERRRK